MCGYVGVRGPGGPGANSPFTLEPILLELEGENYVGPILLVPLANLIAGHRLGGDVSGLGYGVEAQISKVGASGGSARVQVRYGMQLLTLSLQDGEDSPLQKGPCVLPILKVQGG